MRKPKRIPTQASLKKSLVAASVVAALVLGPQPADAATMGRLSVWSGLGQPLRAEVEVSATPEEQGTLIARIATPDMYRQAGLEYTPAISGLRVMVDRRGARPVIRISSETPMREAFLDILLELSWANGRLAREYTVLLDPVDTPAAVGRPGAAPLAPPVALPETRMSYSLSQRGAPEGKPGLPPPGSPGAPAPEAGSRGAPVAKPLPSLRPNYAPPSEARLTPAVPSPMPAPVPATVAQAPATAPAPVLDPRATARARGVETPPPAPVPAPAPVAVAPAPVAPAPAPAPAPVAPAPRPAAQVPPAPQVTQAAQAPVSPAVPAAAREQRPAEPPRISPPPPPEPRPIAPKTLAQLEEELRAAERGQLRERPAAKESEKRSAKEAAKEAAKEKAAAKKAKAAEEAARIEAAKAARLSRTPAPGEAPASPNTYTIQRGDTLMKIARETKLEAVSLDQMLVALFRNNEAAFEGNMNRMKAGRILNLPEPEKVAEVSRSAARREVVAQSADFAAYRAKLAEIAKSGPAKDNAAQQSASGKITPKVEEAKAAPGPKDQLKLSRTLSGKTGKAEGKAAFEEDAAARERALKEANSRVAELEQNVKNLQALIELKNRSMAELQRQAKGGQGTPPADALKNPKAASATPGQLAAPGSDGKVATSGAGAGNPQDALAAPPNPGLNAQANSMQGGAAKAAPVEPQTNPVKETPSRDNSTGKSGGMVSVLTHPALWGSAAALGALLLGWFGFSLLRSRNKVSPLKPMKSATAEPSDSLAQRLRSARQSMQAKGPDGPGARSAKVPVLEVDDPVVAVVAAPAEVAEAAAPVVAAPASNPLAAKPGAPVERGEPQGLGQPVQPPQPLPVRAPEAVVAVEAAPVAAVASMPVSVTIPIPAPIPVPIPVPAPTSPVVSATPAPASRGSIHLELLRLYAERKELEQFDALAQELHRISGGTGPDWVEASALGRRIDPGNPIYAVVEMPQSAAAAVIEAVPVSPSVQPEQPVQPVVVTPPEALQPGTPDRVITTPVGVPMPDPFKGVDFDFGEFSNTAPKEPKPASVAAPVQVVVVPPAIDPPEIVAPAPPPVAMPLDLASINLDLPKAPAAPAKDEKLDEVGAKLELARAYREMGDTEGARELLTEVINEGNADQQSEARDMLARLG